MSGTENLPEMSIHAFIRARKRKLILFAVISLMAVFELAYISNNALAQHSRYLWFSPDSGSLQTEPLFCNHTGCWDALGNNYVTEIVEMTNVGTDWRSVLYNYKYGQKICPLIPPKLQGPIKIMTNIVSPEEIVNANPDVEFGGRFRPKQCLARRQVAIIVPFYNRSDHLSILLNNLHPILQRQQLDYGIFVIEQHSPPGGAVAIFNRGALLNVGYLEAKKLKKYNCFIFHDVDLLPEDDRNLYSCLADPRHMAVAMDKSNYTLIYETFFGGVCAFTDEQFMRVNGFSNVYWGWGGEDDDLAQRVLGKKMKLSRYPADLARYKMIKHGSDSSNPINPKRFQLLKSASLRFSSDGLINLNYTLLDYKLKPLYTSVLVDIGTAPKVPLQISSRVNQPRTKFSKPTVTVIG